MIFSKAVPLAILYNSNAIFIQVKRIWCVYDTGCRTYAFIANNSDFYITLLSYLDIVHKNVILDWIPAFAGMTSRHHNLTELCATVCSNPYASDVNISFFSL